MRGKKAADSPVFPYLEPEERSMSICREQSVFRHNRVFASDGTPLTRLDAGTPGEPVVLLINALGASGLFLGPLAERLSQQFHVVTWESRGLPDFAAAPGELDLSIPRHSRDAVQILSRSDVTAEAVVAFCSGSNVAVHAISAGALRAKSLCIISPSMELPDVEEKTDYQRTMPPIWNEVSQVGLENASMVRAIIRQSCPVDDGSLNSELTRIDKLPFKTDDSTLRYAQMQSACQTFDWAERLTKLKLPSLVLHAAVDKVIHVQSSAAVAGHLQDAAFEVVPDCDHFAIYTSTALHESVAAFLGEAKEPVSAENPVR